jgi:type IV pilus assembly protein PilQ
MISILALRTVLLAALAGVQGLAVVSEGDRTQVFIEVDGSVTYQHEHLGNPPRIVVDVVGAQFLLPQQRFLNIDRGGVLGLRSSQFQSGVVRVVIDLADAVDYRIDTASGGIVVSFPNRRGPFDAWRSAPATAAAPVAPAPSTPAGPLAGAAVPTPVSLVADRATAPVAVTPAATTPAPVAPVAPRQPDQPALWVEFRNTPIVDVLGTFADFSRRSIVPGQGVSTQAITATIQGQPWDEAMRAILAGQGLAARELPSGIIMVTSLEHQRKTETQEEVITRSFPLKYVAADSVVLSVRNLLAGAEGPTGTVTAIRASNMLIVQARESLMQRIQERMEDIDRPSAQVTVKVRIMAINRTRARALGFRYEFIDSGVAGGGPTRIGSGSGIEVPTRVDVGGSTIAAIGNAMEKVTDATFTAVASLLLNRHTLVAWLDAAQSVQLAQLQADPTVRVLNNHTARIQVGSRVPIRVVDPGAAGAQGPQAQVRMEEVGVILQITPSVVGDQIRLDLHAERSFIAERTPDGQFVFGTAETTTQILVEDGATTVISGLTSTDFSTMTSGIPVLMNLPVIGALFRQELVTDEQSDLIIMVTPHIDRAPAF